MTEMVERILISLERAASSVMEKLERVDILVANEGEHGATLVVTMRQAHLEHDETDYFSVRATYGPERTGYSESEVYDLLKDGLSDHQRRFSEALSLLALGINDSFSEKES